MSTQSTVGRVHNFGLKVSPQSILSCKSAPCDGKRFVQECA